MEILQKTFPVFMLIFVLSTMLTMGLGLKVSQIIAPLLNVRLVAMSLLANFLLMPLAAVAIAKLLQLHEALDIGLLLSSTAAGAPFLPKMVQIAKGNLAFAVGLMVLLMVVTVGYLPLVLPLLLPGVSVSPLKIAQSLMLVMLLPLAISLAINAKFPAAAARAKPPLNTMSNVSLILTLLLLIVIYFNSLLSVLGTRGFLAAFIFISMAYGVGWLLGGPTTENRAVLSLGTSQRNIAAALLVGSQSFSDPKVVVMVIVVAVVGLLVIPMSRMMSKRIAAAGSGGI